MQNIQIVKLLRTGYTGDEYLVEFEGLYKRSVQLKNYAAGIFRNRLSDRFKLLNKFRGRFILPDFIDLTDTQPSFLFPYHEEADIRNVILDDEYRFQIAFQLMESFETLHHISSMGFGIWGFHEMLISDKLYILPPLWVNYSSDCLNFIKNRKDVFIAPEILEGKSPTSASDIYVIGKILEILLPDTSKGDVRKTLDLMTDPNPNKRPTHFSRLFSQNESLLGTKPLVSAVKKEFVLPHIIERDEELGEFMNFFEKRKDSGVHSFFVKGNTRVGKSTFLSLIQKELRNSGWKTISASTVKQLGQELLQLSEKPEWSGVEMDDFNYLWNLGNTYNLERVTSIVGKLLDQIDEVAIFIDDFELIDKKFLHILKMIKNMILNSNIMVIASSVADEIEYVFDDFIKLKPFDINQSKRLLILLLGSHFVKKYSGKIDWIYKITGGYPGYIFNLLKLLNNAGNLVIEDGYWKLDGETTYIEGFGDYIKNVFNNLDESERQFVFYLSCISEKFERSEFYDLIEILEADKKESENIFLELQKKGLIHRENDIFRFSLKDIWEMSYNLCPESTKEYIHKSLASITENLSKKAWHYKCIGLNRSAANVYIQASRRTFRKNESVDLACNYLEEAFSLLDDNDISISMKAYRAFFIHFKGQNCPEDYIRLFKKSDKYYHLYLEEIYIKNETENLIKKFERKFDPEYSPDLCNHSCYLWAMYYYALSLSDVGKLDFSLNITNRIINLLNEFNLHQFARLRIKTNDLMSSIFLRKNQLNMAYTISERNISLTKKYKIFSLLPEVYFTAGKIMNVYGPIYAQPLLEKSIEASKNYFSEANTLNAMLELANNFLYSGEINKMFEYLEKSREISRIFNNKNALAESYLIEGLYHSYNRQLNEAIEDFEKADNLLSDVYLKGRTMRFIATAYLLCEDFENFSSILSRQIPSMMEFGFGDVVKIFNSENEADIRQAFDTFRKNNILWKEEVALAFSKKLTEYASSDYEAFLESKALMNLKTHQKLSLAMIYEAMAYFYSDKGFKRKAMKFARNAYEMYKKMNLNNICNILDERILKIEESVEDLLQMISNNLRSETINRNFVIKVFDKIETVYISQKNETEVLHEIINFSKTINASADPSDILNEFTNWIASVVPVSKVILMVLEKEKILYHSHPMIKHTEYEDTLPRILEMKPQYIRTPFEIKMEFFIDDTKKVILYIFNPKLMMSSEEFDKIALFTENLEPIMSMAIRNSISYRSSILDPLTKLYTRWYYTQRLNEEFDKSQRLNTSLSVIMADIDNFKSVNDNYGHKEGDEVLKVVATTMKQQTRNYDIVGRYGGEEFIIILPNTSAMDAKIIAERMREAIQNICEFKFKFTCSFGVASTENNSYTDPQLIITDADKALYMSKNKGKNLVTAFWTCKDE